MSTVHTTDAVVGVVSDIDEQLILCSEIKGVISHFGEISIFHYVSVTPLCRRDCVLKVATRLGKRFYLGFIEFCPQTLHI